MDKISKNIVKVVFGVILAFQVSTLTVFSQVNADGTYRQYWQNYFKENNEIYNYNFGLGSPQLQTPSLQEESPYEKLMKQLEIDRREIRDRYYQRREPTWEDTCRRITPPGPSRRWCMDN